MNFSGAGLNVSAEHIIEITQEVNNSGGVLDLVAMMQANPKTWGRFEVTGVIIYLNSGGQLPDTFGWLDVTLWGQPANHHCPVPLALYQIHPMRPKYIHRAGTTATRIFLVGLSIS